MKYKHFPAPFFSHFIQLSPTIAKLKSLHGVLRGPFAACPPPFGNFKSPLSQPICSSKSYKYNDYDKTK